MSAALPIEFYNKYLELLDQFYPDWHEWDETSVINKETILIPELLDLTKKIVGPIANNSERRETAKYEDFLHSSDKCCVKFCFSLFGDTAWNWEFWGFSEPSGLKSKFSRKGILGNLQGDNGERKFQEKFAALNIGGILIANVSKKEIADFKAKMNRQDPTQQKFCQKQDDFEVDFIFMHPKMGIYVIEVKSGQKDNELSREGKKQLKILDGQLKDFLEECTGNVFIRT